MKQSWLLQFCVAVWLKRLYSISSYVITIDATQLKTNMYIFVGLCVGQISSAVLFVLVVDIL